MKDFFPLNHFLKVSGKQDDNKVLTHSDKNSNELPPPILESNNSLFGPEEINSFEAQIAEILKENIGEMKYNTYFSSSFKLLKIEEGKIYFSILNEFIKNMIEKHYYDTLNRILFDLFNSHFEIILKELSKSETSNLSQASSPKFNLDLTPSNTDLKQEVDSAYLNHVHGKAVTFDPSKTFDNFIVGPSNNLAHSSAISVSRNPGKIYPSLYLFSDSGLGKTHLLHGIANEIKDKHPSLRIILTNAREFMNEMIKAIQEKKFDDFHYKYTKQTDVLIIDDIHELKNKVGTQDEFFHVFNMLHTQGKQLIFTSDKTPKEIDGLEERIKTRLSWGLVADIQKPDLETRIAILKRKAIEKDIYLPEDVITLIACSFKNNIRELEGSLIKLGAYASLYNVDIDVEIAKEQLNLNDLVNTKNITLESIAKTVSQQFKIPVADLKSKVRKKEVTLARHIAMYLSHKMVKATLSEIGQFYGGRDHTSVIHGTEKIRKAMTTESDISQSVYQIESYL